MIWAIKPRLKLTTLYNCDIHLGNVITSYRNVFDFTNDKHRRLIKDATENDMFPVEPVAFVTSDKELTTVCVGTRIGH